MRPIRNLEPREANNFALNRVSLLTRQIDEVLSVANIAGWLVAAFSILVGGFGVANIMFVSVKERTPIIGIQKAIGAPNAFILVQVLVESVILCIIGGVIGILSVGLIAFGINQLITFQLLLTTSNIVTGLTLSTLIGILAGIIPAYQASQMDPIGAIRYAM
jgi:putative ABC transport system permease protein